jgi:hypothetical protein
MGSFGNFLHNQAKLAQGSRAFCGGPAAVSTKSPQSEANRLVIWLCLVKIAVGVSYRCHFKAPVGRHPASRPARP